MPIIFYSPHHWRKGKLREIPSVSCIYVHLFAVACNFSCRCRRDVYAERLHSRLHWYFMCTGIDNSSQKVGTERLHCVESRDECSFTCFTFSYIKHTHKTLINCYLSSLPILLFSFPPFFLNKKRDEEKNSN